MSAGPLIDGMAIAMIVLGCIGFVVAIVAASVLLYRWALQTDRRNQREWERALNERRLTGSRP